MIVFDGVSKKYKLPGGGYKTILEDLNFTFPPRNIGLIGENGAGKSTILRMISGAELPDTGHIRSNLQVSFPLGFAGSFNGSLTGIENTRFVARIYGKDTEKVIDYVEDFAELGKHYYAPVRTYSSGMKARLSFGVSLAIDFECYLVDEITAVGDSRFKAKSKKAFLEKLETAKIIMVSHSNSTLKDYCDIGVVMRNGEVRVFEDLDEAIEDHENYMNR
nr:ABC transporter ATP-binding protein [uncultured Cohaesibacter sp.]